MKRSLAAAVVALLALPAAASAHPGVYTVTQTYRLPNTTCKYGDVDQSCLATRTQYAVGNDGWALSFTESNNLAPSAGGMINYKGLPSGWRDTMSAETKRTWPAAQTNLQAHATCAGTALDQSANILAWQDAEDPFFNYVPWQGTSANLGDHPSEWLTLVKNVTGVDLSTLTTADALKTACESGPVNGTFRAADTPASITDAQIAAATGALQSQVTTLQTGLTNVTAQFTAAETARKALVARPLVLTLSAKRAPNVVMVTGAAGTAVSLRMLISSADAKKLKIARTLATKKKTLDAQGAGLLTLTPSKKALKAIKKDVKVTVEAVGGGVTKTASGVFVG